jgi:hypothetical protein
MIPFSVGQEQHLIQIKDSEDDKEKVVVLKQIISECLRTPHVDVAKLPLFLIEELFLRLFQNSTGEFIPLAYLCKAPVGEGDDVCGTEIKLELDVREFVMMEPEGHSDKIVIAPPIGIKFKYPSIEMYEEATGDLKDDLEVILGCIDIIFDDDNAYPAADHTREELLAFWNQQTLAQKKMVYDQFFNTMPHLHYKKVVKCPKCGEEHKIEFNSMLEVFS